MQDALMSCCKTYCCQWCV